MLCNHFKQRERLGPQKHAGEWHTHQMPSQGGTHACCHSYQALTQQALTQQELKQQASSGTGKHFKKSAAHTDVTARTQRRETDTALTRTDTDPPPAERYREVLLLPLTGDGVTQDATVLAYGTPPINTAPTNLK